MITTRLLFIIASLAGSMLLSAQSGVVTDTVEREIRGQALLTGRHPQSQFLSALVLTYVPSNHPDLRIAAYYKQGPKSEIELIEGTVPLAEVIGRLRNSSEPINVDVAVAMMKIRRSHFEVDSTVMKNWLQVFQMTARNAIDQMTAPGLVHLDGTIYQARFMGSFDVQIEVNGAEVGTVRDSDPEFVRWMNGLLKEVRTLQKSPH
jgi:hypothetical protein